MLDAASLRACFAAVMSTEQVARGKPAPDIYLAVAGQLGRRPQRCAAVEDSSNGLRSAAAAGLRVIAIPHPRYPPDPDALGLAAVVLPGLAELTPGVVTGLAWLARAWAIRAGDYRAGTGWSWRRLAPRPRAGHRQGTRREPPPGADLAARHGLPPAGPGLPARRAEGCFTRAAAGR